MTRLRGQLFVADPTNLNQVILAEGKTKMRNQINNKQSQTRIIAEMVIFIALANVLYLISKFYLPFLHLPQGGSITVASMVPILWFALRRGLRWGVEAGIIYGFVHMVISGDIYYPAQIILDYPLAYGALGLAGAFQKRPLIGVGIGVFGRFMCHFLSGAIFFGQYAWAGWNVLAYSAAYNATYLVPELAIDASIIYSLIKTNLIKIYM
jgi:thiamine transporter